MRYDHVDDVLLHTHIHIHKYSDFLVCMIYVGITSACPNNLYRMIVYIHVLITLHACSWGKATGFVRLSVDTKIARSGDLGVIMRYKYHYSVGKVGKLTFFSLLDA